MAKTTLVLVVLDGWGIGRNDESNPIYVVHPPTLEALGREFPVTSLQASGIAVGLPWGEVGNSEVGHLTLGAGKILYQYYPKITLAIQSGTFFTNPVFKKACAYVREHTSTLHLAGLLSNANVHASVEHVHALLSLAEREKISKVALHLWTDGKDCAPKTAGALLAKLPKERIATMMGRYYAMDRNQNWQLTKAAYDLMTQGVGAAGTDPLTTLEATYAKGLTEEYVFPTCFQKENLIRDRDTLILWNYREDSVRQITETFSSQKFTSFPRASFSNLFLATMTPYEKTISAPAAFEPDVVREPLGKVLSDNGLNQLRVAETYKYAHVTYFFNGYIEKPFKNEYRVLVPSLSTAKPEDHPEMQATAVTDRVVEALSNHSFDFILVNYANPDTMAHTSHYEAALAAVRTMDREISKIVKALTNEDILVITGDHGNVEQVLNPTTGMMESQHDPSPVPLYLISAAFRGKHFPNFERLASETMGSLADVAPTILELLHIPQPETMTGESLLEGII